MALRETVRLPLMIDTPGTERFLVVHRYGNAGARPKIYLQAAIHANELPGALAIHHLLGQLDALAAAGAVAGEIVIVPTANPIGLSQMLGGFHTGRYHLNDRTNFNREFHDLAPPLAESLAGRLGDDPAANTQAIRAAARAWLHAYTPPTQAMDMRTQLMRLSIDADYVLDLHCDQQAALHMFVGLRRLETAQMLAADLGAVAVLASPPEPILRTFSGANGGLWEKLAALFPNHPLGPGCFSATVELRSEFDVNHALGQRDAAALIRFMRRIGVLHGAAGPLPEALCAISPIGGMDVGYAPGPGYLVFHVRQGERVRRDQVICDVIDPTRDPGAAITPMRAQSDGVLFVRRPDGALSHPGKVCYRIAGPVDLPHRQGRPGLDD